MHQFERLEVQFYKDFAKKNNEKFLEQNILRFTVPIDPKDHGPHRRVWNICRRGTTSASKLELVRIALNWLARFHYVLLNDMVLRGPDLLTSQTGILLRLRKHPIPTAKNIEKM